MKKLLVLTVVCALAAPVLVKAETANVNVYGTLNSTAEFAKSMGATSGDRYTNHFRLVDNSTNFGVKGSEDLGGDLKGVFQVELDVRPSAGTVPGLRNSMLGLQGNWGTAFMGTWDSPYKAAQYFMDPFYNAGVGWMASLIDQGANLQSFAVRKNQSLNYWTPKFAGVSGQFMYSPKSAAGSSADDFWSAAVSYAEGPINGTVAYEVHNAAVNAATTGLSDTNLKDTGLKLAAGYKLFDTTGLNVAWGQVSRKVSDPDLTVKKSALEFTATHKISDFTIRAGYAISGKVNYSADAAAGIAGNSKAATAGDQDLTGAKQLSLGGSYSLSKRTEVYGLFAKIMNDDNANYNFLLSPVNGNVAGADPQSFAFGIRHTF